MKRINSVFLKIIFTLLVAVCATGYIATVGAPCAHARDIQGNYKRLEVASIAELRAITGSSKNKTCTVLGYYTPGGSGGGQFYWDAASTLPDDGGIVIKATATAIGRWIRLHGGFVSLEEFGCIGDGITVNDTQFQTALSFGNTGALSAKSYAIGSGMTAPSGLSLDMGMSTLIRSPGSGAYDMISNDDSVGGNTGIKIKNIVLDGNKDADSLDRANPADRFAGIALRNCSDSDLTNVTVTATVDGEIQVEGARAGIVVEDSTYIDLDNVIGYSIDGTGVLFVSSTYCSIKNAYGHSNVGSFVSSYNTDFTNYSNIQAHDNGFSQVSVNGLSCIMDNIRCWNGALGYSNINIGHDATNNRSHKTVANNLVSEDGAGWGITVIGSDDVTMSNVVSKSNAIRNLWVGANSNRSIISGGLAQLGGGLGVLYDSGKGHKLSDFSVSLNGSAGISITTGVELALNDVSSFNNGQITPVNSSGVTAVSAGLSVSNCNFYDDQGTPTQEAGMFLSGGVASLSSVYINGNSLYRLRLVSSPLLLMDSLVRFSKAQASNGSFTATAGTIDTVVLNANVRSAGKIIVTPLDDVAAQSQWAVVSVIEGVSFTVRFLAIMGGTEPYHYLLL